MRDDTEPYEALWNRALWYLGRRDYGTKELRQKLLRLRQGKPIPVEEDIDRAIARLLELDLLNDARYAQRLAEALQNKGYGARGIAFELRQRGLDEEIELPQADEDRIAVLLRGKYAGKLCDERGRRSVFNALLRRGFKAGDINKAMRNETEDESDGDF